MKSEHNNWYKYNIFCIDYFLKNKALIDHNNRVSSTYILKNESRIVGFYTLGVSTFDFSDQDRSESYSHSIDLQYFAISKDYQNENFGTKMLLYIVQEVRGISRKIGIRFLTLNAVDNAIEWYLDRGFTELNGYKEYGTKMYLDFIRDIGGD